MKSKQLHQMDLSHQHPTIIRVVRACYNDDARDLVAIAGEHSVDVLLITESSTQTIASFHIGTVITAVAWSAGSTSPTYANTWSIELVVAGIDFGLYLLTKSLMQEEYVFAFAGGLSGHHGRINGMSFCGGRGTDNTRYLATVADDKTLMVWDLLPSLNIPANSQSLTDQSTSRPQPTAYAIPFHYPLIAVASHPTTSKQLLVADARGSIFVIDWRSDPQDSSASSRHSSVLELNDPLQLSSGTLGLPGHWSGAVDWRRDNPDIVGAVFGSMFSVWDMAQLHGGKPTGSGATFPDGASQFRWCPTYTDYFAISTQSLNRGALIHVHNLHYLQAQPTPFQISHRPHFTQDFDFLALEGIPRIAAAVGRSLLIFSIGVDV